MVDSRIDVNQKMSRLVDRFFECKVVPFIGAGVSKNALCKSGNGQIGDTGKMIGAIAKKLLNLMEKDHEPNQWLRWCCSFLECGEENNQSNCGKRGCLLKQLSGNTNTDKYLRKYMTLDKLCEMYTWVAGKDAQRSLVKDVLKIQKFSELTPTAAHRYISFLAREGLIEEVITTNYDCCLEKAYADTFIKKFGKRAALVITDLEEYREYSGKFYFNEKIRCLKIYKINGCATKLKNGGLSPDKILLTERQLQGWRDRSWARDLLHDCLRSRTLVFSGFGSDEPQVRFTALQIAEEFQNSSNNGGQKQTDGNRNSCWDHPNAPFVAAFERHLSFNQIQILYSYALAHNDSLDHEDIQYNAITGADAKKLGATEDKEHLTADLFWKRVYQAAFWQLLKKYCNHDTPIYAYLSSCIYPVEALLSGFKSWLVPPEKPCGRFPELLEMDNDLQVTVLTRWIHCIRYGETHCSKGIYLPLIEKPVLLPLVMLILYLTAGNQESWEEINRIVDAGNHLFILNIIENLPVILFHDTSVFNKALKNAGAMLRNVNIGIIVSCKLEEEAGIIHQRFDLPGTGKNQDLPVKKDVTIYKIPFKELFCRDGDMPRSVDALRDQFFASLRMPKLIAAKARPKLRNRVRKIS